jgi:hypothetical protein
MNLDTSFDGPSDQKEKHHAPFAKFITMYNELMAQIDAEHERFDYVLTDEFSQQLLGAWITWQDLIVPAADLPCKQDLVDPTPEPPCPIPAP